MISLLPILFAPAALPRDAERPPNIVLILCDDMGYGDLGCYGHPAIKTPNLDKLALEGLRMTRCYSSSPVCSPSRAGIITGRHPHRAGIRDWIPPDSGIALGTDQPSIAKVLKGSGYATAHVGKWHLSSRFNGVEPTPADHGFDHWFSTQNNAAPTHQDPTNFVRNRKKVGPLKGNSSTIIADEALDWLEGVKDQPYALFVWFHAPHEIVAVPDEFRAPYREHDTPEEPNRSVYYGSIALIDREVGRLLDAVDARGERDQTFVFFTSDNGPETLRRYPNATQSYGVPGPLRGMKLHTFEGGYRIPGIARWPGHIRPGSVSDEPTCNVDLFPTFAAMAGAKLPEGVPFDGTSLLPLFDGKPIARTVPLYWEYDFSLNSPWRSALVEGNWKLLGNEDLTQFQLFDLSQDIHEDHDLSSERTDLVREMSKTMRVRKAEINPPPKKPS